jgi:2-dehydro-3-deoxyglucarate aldolase/4-hydroxy-2-oxoheptanedioate aldolase
MRENPVKAALRQGRTAVGVGLTIAANANVVRIMANAGYDFLFIDVEHTLLSPETLMSVVQMARACGISPIVRVQDTEYHLIANALDSGADGVIVPRVESAAQAERVVAFARFPPQGVRGCGTIATLDFVRQDWREALPWLNAQTLIAVQVESQRAIDAVEHIVRVDGIDALVIGPLDLSIDLGVPGQFDHPRVVAAMERVTEIGLAHGVAVGTVLGSPAAFRPWWEKGMRFLTCGSDTGMLGAAAHDNVKGVREFAGPR